MIRRIFFIVLMIACWQLAVAQNHLFVVRDTMPVSVNVVHAVDSVTFADEQVNIFSGEQVRTYNVSAVKDITTEEPLELTESVMPESFRKDFEFDIEFDDADKVLASHQEVAPTDSDDQYFDDFVENSNWNYSVTITYGGDKANVEGDVDSVAVQTNGNHVTVTSSVAGMQYILKGASDNGSFKLYGNKKTKVVLNGVSLTNPTGAAINNQCKKRLFVVLNDGTVNRLTDGKSYKKVSGEDMKGCVFSEGQICLSGGGELYVVGNQKNGIATDDYMHQIGGYVNVVTSAKKGTAIKVQDDFIMGGGAAHLLTEGGAAKAVKSDSLININGGKLVAIVKGDAIWDSDEDDYSSACGVKADYTVSLKGGEVRVLATGTGGKGIAAGQENEQNQDVIIDGADVYVRTAGCRIPEIKVDDKGDTPSSSPKGIKSTHNVEIYSGNVYVRCSGGDGSEGIEAKHDINIKGGKIRSYCFDDGINAVNSKIDGGDIFVYSSGNDGYDVNGGLFINGGTLFAIGAPDTQAGIDNDGKTFGLCGGQVVGLGGYSSTPWDSKSTQASVLCYLKKIVKYLSMTDKDGNNIMTIKTPSVYNPLGTLLSCDKIQLGGEYRILTFDTLISGEEVNGIIENPVYENATVEYEFVQEKLLTTLGSKK